MLLKPYGAWKSPITSDLVASAGIRFGDIQIDGEDIYWIESRPGQGGRNTIIRRTPDGNQDEIIPEPFNARSRVHEYGGGAMLADGGVVYFSHDGDRRIYRVIPAQTPRRVSNEENMRYADFIMDRRRDRLILVREDHSQPGREPINTLVALPLHRSGKTGVLVSGNDFYASPRLSPDGSRLAWLTWNHPNMPWDGTELWLADVHEDGGLENQRRIAGDADESIFQPEWSSAGMLYFVSDRTGWWNLYCLKDSRIEPVIQKAADSFAEAEFGLPQWVFGMSTYAFQSANRMICTYSKGGLWYLASINIGEKKLETIDSPYTYITQIRSTGAKAVFNAASPTEVSSLVEYDLSNRHFQSLRKSSQMKIDRGYISTPQTINYPTGDASTVQAFFYQPRNIHQRAPETFPPPLIVMIHGGPTGAADNGLKLKIQYWTSRGFAVLNANYRGSTGFGRAYRQRLNGHWGLADVEDCIYGAKYLIEKKLVDENRLIITGGSAGGFTVLAALVFHDLYNAGASYYGISDLKVLAADSHKFESRYLDRLVAPYPEKREIYMERSPLYNTGQLSSPVIFFQGLDDKVVPPTQSEKMVAALRRKKIPVVYLTFEGEGHGFRRSENIRRALDAELYFYARIFGFEVADEIEPLKIENLEV
jgi:dipeptidyl aminopeptidase/acylaminoacyl peptidase